MLTEARTRSAIGRQNRVRGARFENDVARALFDRLGLAFVRDRRKGGAGRGDLVCEEAAFPVLIECKSSTGTAFLAEWIAQATAAARQTGQWPCIVYRLAGRPMRVRVPMEAIGAAFGGGPGDCALWVDTDLDGLAYLAAELMAREALRDAGVTTTEVTG